MKKIDNSQFIWAEKYRPQCIDDMIISEEMRSKFLQFRKDGRFPHLLLSSVTPGIGKTSITNAIIKELEADTKWINCSQDRGIDTFKYGVKDFVTSVSIDDSPKIVVGDEADGLTNDAQKALRAIIEEYSKHSTFIFTCNYKEKLMEPLRNRFIQFDFDAMYTNHKKEIALQVLERLKFILENEGITYSLKDLSTIIQNFFPSIRKMILILQQCIVDGKLIIDENIISTNNKMQTIMDTIKNKNFSSTRKELNDINDPGALYSYIFKHLDSHFTPASQPQAVLLTAKYQDMHANARDKIITAAAFAVELMLTNGIEMI